MHVFFEGFDDPIYLMPELRRRASRRSFEVHVCRGKKIVRDVRDEIRALGESYEDCLFFVDRDYDDLLGSQIEACERLYISDKYAIENEVANADFLEAVLSDVVTLSRADPAFELIISEFRNLENQFVSEIKTLCGWILAAKEKGLKPNLSNLNGLNTVFEIVDGKISKCADGFASFLRRVGVQRGEVDIGSVKNWVQTLSEMDDVDLWLRGKFKSWFFRAGIIDIFSRVNMDREAAGIGLIQVPSLIASGRLFELAVGRVQPPNSLSCFLNDHLLGPAN